MAVVTGTKGAVMPRRLRKSRRAVVQPTPTPPARPRRVAQQPEIGGSSRNRRLAALLAGLFATGLGLIGAGRPTIWYDEAVTLNLLHRPFGDTWPVLREVDAVHGIYYVVLRGWTWLTGDSIEAVRAFSALGVGVTAAATVLLVARHQRLRIADRRRPRHRHRPGAGLDRARRPQLRLVGRVRRTLHARAGERLPPPQAAAGLGALRRGLRARLLLAPLPGAPRLGHGIAVMVGFPKGRMPWTLTAIGTADRGRAARADRLEPARPGGVADRHELLLGPDAPQPAHERPVRGPGLDPLGLPRRAARVLRAGHPPALEEGPPLAALRARALGRPPDGGRRGVRRGRRRRDAPALRHLRRPGVRDRRDRRRVLAAEVDPGPRRRRRARGRRPDPGRAARAGRQARRPAPARGHRRGRGRPTPSTSPCRRRAASPPPTPSAFEDIDDISAPLDPEPMPFFPGIRDPGRSRASTWPGSGSWSTAPAPTGPPTGCASSAAARSRSPPTATSSSRSTPAPRSPERSDERVDHRALATGRPVDHGRDAVVGPGLDARGNHLCGADQRPGRPFLRRTRSRRLWSGRCSADPVASGRRTRTGRSHSPPAAPVQPAAPRSPHRRRRGRSGRRRTGRTVRRLHRSIGTYPGIRLP